MIKKKIPIQTFRYLIYLFILVGNLYSQEKIPDSKTVFLSEFSPFQSEPNLKLAEKIFNSLRNELETKGFNVKKISGNSTSQKVTQAKEKGALFYIDGQYVSQEGKAINIFIQIYNPDTGYVIDAIPQFREYSVYEDVDWDLDELKLHNEKQIDSINKRAVIGLVSNLQRKEKRDNIENSILRSPISELNFNLAKDDSNKTIREVFQQFQKMTVASNVITDLKKQPVSISVVTQQQIKLSGARTLNELLMIYVPGYFTVEDQDDTIAAFRGFAADNNAKVLLLINGHNMNTEFFFGAPDAILNGLNFDYIERIEVIRGPGSVTLGQGALLGVINIITKNGIDISKTSISTKVGHDNYITGTIQSGGSGKEIPELKTFFQASTAKYKGQEIRNEGWANVHLYENQGGFYDLFRGQNAYIPTKDISPTDWVVAAGLPGEVLVNRKNVATNGTRFKKADNNVVTGNIQYKGLDLTIFNNNQTRDLYNFYRDRSKISNVITHGSVGYSYDITENISLKLKSNYTIDDIMLKSQEGFTLGGTRESRYGGSAILNINNLLKNHNIAIGTEFRKYNMGQKDANNNNFLINSGDKAYQNNMNENNKYIYPFSISVNSLFIEDFYKVSEKVDLFGGIRYDRHPYWGANFSPRVGFLYAQNSNLRFRVSYQEGFRGMVGVGYSGGFQGDGFLRLQNFRYIQSASIPVSTENGSNSVYGNIPETKPEKLKSYEFSINYTVNSNLSLESVLFYNRGQNIIDVGVIYADPSRFTMPRVGSEQPGDWNGYWFYRNNLGEIRQVGSENSIHFTKNNFSISASHSLVKVVTATQNTSGSMYLTTDTNSLHFKAYPENIFKLNTHYRLDNISFSLTYLYYPHFYSSLGNRVVGNQLANIGAIYSLGENLEFLFQIKNLLNQTNLYPLINNVGNQGNSDATPSVEKRTFWVGMSYIF